MIQLNTCVTGHRLAWRSQESTSKRPGSLTHTTNMAKGDAILLAAAMPTVLVVYASLCWIPSRATSQPDSSIFHSVLLPCLQAHPRWLCIAPLRHVMPVATLQHSVPISGRCSDELGGRLHTSEGWLHRLRSQKSVPEPASSALSASPSPLKSGLETTFYP